MATETVVPQNLGVGVDASTGTEVEFYLAARDLPKKDLTSKTDCFIVVDAQDPFHRGWVPLGKTEVAYDSPNPNFAQQFRIIFFFEEIQNIRIRLYDEDVRGDEDLDKHDLLGEVKVVLGDLMATPGQVQQLPLDKAPDSKLIIQAEEMAYCSESLAVQFAAKDLDNKDGLFGKSDPFLRLSRMQETGDLVQVWQSEVVMNNLDPEFDETTLSLQQICNGDLDRPLQIQIYDYDKDGNHQFLGKAALSVRDILNDGNVPKIPLVNEKKQKKLGDRYKGCGKLTLARPAVLTKHPTFLDYIKGGCNFNLNIAIDFTGSNGNPAQPGTLHYLDQGGGILNQYQQAMVGIGSVLESYDTDKVIPVSGFGGKVGGREGQVSHYFPVGEEEGNAGIPGCLEAYANALFEVGLSGPTLLAPTIQKAQRHAELAQAKQRQSGEQAWIVLLVLCDGTINDMQPTIDAIVDASKYPLSIIIVGVGEADFADMELLDGDVDETEKEIKMGRRHRLRQNLMNVRQGGSGTGDGGSGGVSSKLKSSSGEKCTRDIVQFVPFRDYFAAPGSTAESLAFEQGEGEGGEERIAVKGGMAAARLAQAVLEEVPQQMLAYYQAHNVLPHPPRRTDDETLNEALTGMKMAHQK